jgi:hypothetical protein
MIQGLLTRKGPSLTPSDHAHHEIPSVIVSGSSRAATSAPKGASRSADRSQADLRPFFDFTDSRNR